MLSSHKFLDAPNNPPRELRIARAQFGVRLGLGEQQCEIFKTGKLYYVIIGKPGEELPTPFLRKIAAELTKRN